ncbi:hypothetical protein F2Q69_00061997 [Brassica cretica]|uniref:L-2-hydroxyglutarate dehydrogenase, mitochondrial n=1 Tax=Brassica cretica TaxID=69181 RepID=A0A8S9RFD6_BRACR|nr:hypothetical protein F2Q69_00061997 [Brassica cretica]
MKIRGRREKCLTAELKRRRLRGDSKKKMLASLGRRWTRLSTRNLKPTWKLLNGRGVSGVAETIAKERVDAVVIGAGVVGLAVARELSLRGREVLILDAASSFGTVTSSRNSEVIHAGIYYPPNSLKVQPLSQRVAIKVL